MNGTIKSIYNSTQGFMGQKTVGPEVKAWKEAGPAWEYPPYTLAAKGTCLIQVDEHHLVAVFASDKTRTEDVGSKLIAWGKACCFLN